jgi:predicted DCC family thiol-disulfide oxidoreductase YuxK
MFQRDTSVRHALRMCWRQANTTGAGVVNPLDPTKILLEPTRSPLLFEIAMMSQAIAKPTSTTYEVEVFYDGGCPLCVREIGMLRRWDRQQKIRFTDIDSPDFQPAEYGKTSDEFMAQIYGRLPDGTWIRGVEVFRRLYSAVGFGPLVFLTRLPIISQLMDVGYFLFAKNRLRLTGRCNQTSCSVKRTP